MKWRFGGCSFETIDSKRLFRFLWILAFAVRLAIVLGFGLHQEPMRAELQLTAMSLATTGVYGDPYSLPTGPSAHAAPLYTLVVAAVFFLFGTENGGELALYVVNIALASLVYAMLPKMAQELGLGRLTGIAAGLFGAAVPFHFLNEARAGDAPLGALALMAILTLSIRTWKAKGFQLRRALLSGCVWGLSLLLLPALLPVGIGIAVASALLVRRPWPAAHMAVVLVIAGLFLLPWTLRNHLVLGSAIWFRSNFGIELRLAYNEWAKPDIDSNRAGGSFDRFHPFVSQQAAADVQREGEVAYSRRLQAEAIAWIREHPREAARLTALRAIYFWFPKTLKPAQTILLSVLSLLAFIGLFLMRRRAIPAFPALLVLWTTFPPLYFLLQSAVRYRYPINWTLLLAAAFAARVLTIRLQERSKIPSQASRANRQEARSVNLNG